MGAVPGSCRPVWAACETGSSACARDLDARCAQTSGGVSGFAFSLLGRPRLIGDAVAVPIVPAVVARLPATGRSQAHRTGGSAVRDRCHMPERGDLPQGLRPSSCHRVRRRRSRARSSQPPTFGSAAARWPARSDGRPLGSGPSGAAARLPGRGLRGRPFRADQQPWALPLKAALYPRDRASSSHPHGLGRAALGGSALSGEGFRTAIATDLRVALPLAGRGGDAARANPPAGR
jgi:hypothetical protein